MTDDAVMKRVFSLPKEDWQGVKDRLDWCAEHIGPRSRYVDYIHGGTWYYDAVYHDVTVFGAHNIVLYSLRWA